MFIEWTKNLKDQDEKSNFENKVKSSRAVLERLSEIIDDQDRAINTTEISINTFDQPNWALKQAYIQGYKARGNKLKLLIDLDQQKERD